MYRLELFDSLSLTDPTGLALADALAQPKRVAILAYLAVEGLGRFQRRDRLLALFWPELSTTQARQALRQSLYYLRRHLTPEVVITRGAEEVAISPAALWCDVAAFEALLAAARTAEAMALYRGDLLPGFHVAAAAPEFDAWLEAARVRLRRQAVGAAWALEEAAEQNGNVAGAVHWGHRAAELVPGDEVSARRLISLLSRLGDRAGAVEAYEGLARRLARDLNVVPSEDTRALVARVRQRRPTPHVPSGGGHVPAALLPVGRRRPRAMVAALAGAGLALAAFLPLVIRAARPAPPVIAVGSVSARLGPDTARFGGAIPDLLTAALGRVSGLEVVPRGRLYAQLGAGQESGPTLRNAAARAGATEVIEGQLSAEPGGLVQLALRRLRLATGAVTQTVALEAATVPAALDAGAAELARGMGLEAPVWRLAETAPASLVARRFYDEGVRALNQGDLAAARRLFRAALRDDSTLAMAAYYLTLTEGGLGQGPLGLQHLWLQAARMADVAPDQERLFIKSAWANASMDPAGLTLAETLVVRYPRLPDAHYQLAQALVVSGDALGALPHLRQAVTMDSAALGRGGPRCVACDALHAMVNAYWSLDSLRAAERVAREWSRLSPDAPSAHVALAGSLERQGRVDEALAALERAAAAYPPEQMRLTALAFALRGGDFERVDRGLLDVARAAEARWRFEAYWWLTISLRMQGRLREALAMARAYRAVQDSMPEEAGTALVLHAIPEAVVLLELGRYREAAALFDSIAAAPVGASATYRARHRTWHLTHKASALHLAGDTAALRPLADSIEAAGRGSGFGRDRVLHHYVRALVAATRGEYAEAVAEHRKNTVPYYGLADYRLAEALVALGRPREAIAPLRRVLGGPLEAGNLYVNFTAVRELLGRAYEAAGDADSARAQYRWVEDARRRADK